MAARANAQAYISRPASKSDVECCLRQAQARGFCDPLLMCMCLPLQFTSVRAKIVVGERCSLPQDGATRNRWYRARRCAAALLIWTAVSAPAISGVVLAQDNSGSASPPADRFSSEQVAEKLLDQIRRGFEARDSRKMLGAFDPDRMQGYLSFKDQVEALFAQYSSFRIYVRIGDVSLEKDRGVVTAMIKLEGSPVYGDVALSREAELSFELTHTERGWKIVDVSPRNFFS